MYRSTGSPGINPIRATETPELGTNVKGAAWTGLLPAVICVLHERGVRVVAEAGQCGQPQTFAWCCGGSLLLETLGGASRGTKK